MSTCRGCGRASNYAECVKCKSKRERQESFDLGYQQGFIAGEKTKQTGLTKERWRQLVQLCHPDKHGDSKTAQDVSAWLNENKPDE